MSAFEDKADIARALRHRLAVNVGLPELLQKD